MGDRGNIFVVQSFNNKQETCSGVYLYTHWCGSDLPELVNSALSREQRWSDPAYLTRILFSELIDGDVDGETGYGISLFIEDNGNPIVRVDPFQQVVDFVSAREVDTYVPTETSWSFNEYIEASDEELMTRFSEVRV